MPGPPSRPPVRGRNAGATRPPSGPGIVGTKEIVTDCVAVRSWEANWDDLATMFDYPPDIRRLIYTTNAIEGYNRQLRKVTKTKGAFPTAEAARKLLFLVTRDITRKWTMPPQNWACILNQLAIRFEGRFPTPT